MLMKRTRIGLLTFFCVLQATSFVIPLSSRQPATSAPQVQPSSPSTRLYQTTETLRFQGDFSHSSDPFPGSRQDVIDFFTNPETRNLLISAGGRRPVIEQPVTPELLALWTKVCDEYYGPQCLPTGSEDDEVVCCESVIQFPGLKLVSLVCSGVKLLESDDGLPLYECILIGEKKTPYGPAPLVWLFNKLTGADPLQNSNDFDRPQAHAKSTITVKQVESSDKITTMYSFQFDLKMLVKVEFPSLLVKILPTSKERMEEQGSASVVKAISGDVIEALRGARLEFTKRHHQTVTV